MKSVPAIFLSKNDEKYFYGFVLSERPLATNKTISNCSSFSPETISTISANFVGFKLSESKNSLGVIPKYSHI